MNTLFEEGSKRSPSVKDDQVIKKVCVCVCACVVNVCFHLWVCSCECVCLRMCVSSHGISK